MDKEQMMAADLDPDKGPSTSTGHGTGSCVPVLLNRPMCYRGSYLFEDEFDVETIRRNFDFYEPRTVHESSLSPCVHSILASRIGKATRHMKCTCEPPGWIWMIITMKCMKGLHITSMGGTWMSVVYGFGGMKIRDGLLSFDPILPRQWKGLSFKILYRRRMLEVIIKKDKASIYNRDGDGLGSLS